MPAKHVQSKNKPATKGDIEDLTIIVGNTFAKMDKRFDEMDKKIDDKIDGVNERIEGIHRRFDAHDLDCVKRDEYGRLEKRVKVLETA